MATVSNPQMAFAASLISGTAMAQSANLTVAFNITGVWEARLNFKGIQPNTTGISAGWEVYAYQSTDGGATYATVASVAMSVTRGAAALTQDIVPLRLETGQWLLRIISGGNGTAGTWSFAIGTQGIITGVINA